MSDLLSAASLFLAVIGLLYSVWYGEITTAIAMRVPTHAADRGPATRELRRVARTRALPLFMSATLLASVLMPDLIAVIYSAIRRVAFDHLGALRYYDAVRMLFAAIAVTSVGLAIHTGSLFWHVRRRLREASQPRRQ